MKLLFNCSNLRFGGGKTVGINIIKYFLQYTSHELYLIAPSDCGYEQFADTRIHLKIIDRKYNSFRYKHALNSRLLPALENKEKPDVVLSLGNIAFRSAAPQYLLIHQSYLVYRAAEQKIKMPLMEALYLKLMVLQIKRHLKYADIIGLQTNTILSRFKTLFPQYKNTCITPNSVALSSLRKIKPLLLKQLSETISLLFFSKLYPHKNFDILMPVAAIIKERNLPISITITIEENESLLAKNFIRKISEYGFEDIIKNIGHVEFSQIPALYEKHHGLFLPTLLESFSGTYIESMHFGRPIFTSNFDFSKEICTASAYYFDPFNALEIIETIITAFKNPSEMERKIELGYEISKQMKSWNEIGTELKNIVENKLYKSNN